MSTEDKLAVERHRDQVTAQQKESEMALLRGHVARLEAALAEHNQQEQNRMAKEPKEVLQVENLLEHLVILVTRLVNERDTARAQRDALKRELDALQPAPPAQVVNRLEDDQMAALTDRDSGDEDKPPAGKLEPDPGLGGGKP